MFDCRPFFGLLKWETLLGKNLAWPLILMGKWTQNSTRCIASNSQVGGGSSLAHRQAGYSLAFMNSAAVNIFLVLKQKNEGSKRTQ